MKLLKGKGEKNDVAAKKEAQSSAADDAYKSKSASGSGSNVVLLDSWSQECTGGEDLYDEERFQRQKDEVDPDRVDLDGVDLIEVDLVEVDLVEVDLDGADLVEVDLHGVGPHRG